jgi:hypothetical protein
MKRIIPLTLLVFWTRALHADSSSHFILRAIVPPSINTNITQTHLSSTKSLWIFSSKMNSKHLRESQKFEVEGLDQAGIETHLKKVTASDRTIQYELLVQRLRSTAVTDRPIFLKISAN